MVLQIQETIAISYNVAGLSTRLDPNTGKDFRVVSFGRRDLLILTGSSIDVIAEITEVGEIRQGGSIFDSEIVPPS